MTDTEPAGQAHNLDAERIVLGCLMVAPAALPVPCGCPRQADLWLCRARPHLSYDPDGRRCELDLLLDATDSDYWPCPAIGGRRG